MGWKKSIMAVGALLMLATACSSEKKGTDVDSVLTNTSVVVVTDTATKPVESAAMAKAWESYMTPGNEHKMLSKSVGNWEAEITFYSPQRSNNVYKLGH